MQLILILFPRHKFTGSNLVCLMHNYTEKTFLIYGDMSPQIPGRAVLLKIFLVKYMFNNTPPAPHKKMRDCLKIIA